MGLKAPKAAGGGTAAAAAKAPFGGDANAALRSVGIIGRGGRGYGGSDCHARLELLMREQTFVLVLAKLTRLLATPEIRQQPQAS